MIHDPRSTIHDPRFMFQRILIANRGEIALRVIRACKEMGIESVAVYSEADRGAPYLDFADQNICIGPATATESYLKIPRLISAAEAADVQAIHPGYGFLSENAHFAEVCRDCKIEFIGPPPEAMQRLGNKNEARKLAQKAGVPVVPGSEGLIEKEEDALNLARAMGFPVLIKAAAGGGGRGMRVARDEPGLLTGLKAARQEAESAFKDGSVYLEKYIEQPRHIEVQLLGDRARQYRPLMGARLFVAAPPSEAGGGIAGAEPARRGARRPFARPPCAWRRRPAITAPAPASFCWTRTIAFTSSRSTPASRSSIRSRSW